jgi:hypothetical protein
MPNLLVPVINTSALRMTSSGHYTLNTLFDCSNKSSSFSYGFVIHKKFLLVCQFCCVCGSKGDTDV